MRFIQLSDVRFGATPHVSGAGVPRELVRELRGDAGRVLARVGELAAEHGAAAVLVAGDLLEEADCAQEDLVELHALIARCPVPVVVAPGTRDAVWPGSALSAARRLLELERPADNLVVLEAGQSQAIAGLDVCAAGGAGAAGAVLLVPGADADGVRGADPRWAWVAAGGAAQPWLVREESGRARGGCAGAPLAHELPGSAGGAWLVELGSEPRVTALATAPRRGLVVELEVSGIARASELTERAAAALAAAGSGPADLARLRLSGTWRPPELPRLAPDALRDRAAHAWLEAGDLVLAPPLGSTTMALHLRTLIAQSRRDDAGLRPVDLAVRAWLGEEVLP